MNRGIVYALGAYLSWGLLPIYWKALATVPALEIVAHRIVWSVVILAVILSYQRNWRWVGPALRNQRIVLTFVATAALLTVNWLTYIWAVNMNLIVETSLGYFINPLISVLLGVLFLREQIRPWQWVAIGLAALGVLYLTFNYGSLPWIGLTLGFSFGAYGLLKKTAPLDSMEGQSLEMGLLAIPMLGYLIYLSWVGQASIESASTVTVVLLILSGLATTIPLLLFSAGVRRIPLSMLGFLQYVAPSLQLMIGVFIFDEPFSAVRLVGFSLIWAGLLVYTMEGMMRRRRMAAMQFAS